jgi:hypothetical protein
MKKRQMFYVLSAVLLLTAAVIAFIVIRNPDDTPSPGSKAPTSDTSQTTPPAENTDKTYPVQVFYSKHPESDDDPSKVFPVSRTASDLGLGKTAMTELLKGPSATEQSQGYFTTVRLREGPSSCNDQDFTLDITNGVATLQFCKQFDHLGVVADGQADSEIKATLTQFDTVNKVIILNTAGDCEFDLSGMNLCKQ